MPRFAVSPGHCRGSSGASCSSRFSGRSARCRWAVSPASSAGRPAFSSGSPRLLHLLCPAPTAGCRLSWSRCSSSHDRLQHLLCHSAARSSSRDQCRPHRRCGCGASHHHRGLETRVWHQRCAHIKRQYASFTVPCVKTLGALLSFSFIFSLWLYITGSPTDKCRHPPYWQISYERFGKVMSLRMTQAICSRCRETGVLKERHHLSGGDLARGGHHPRALSISPPLSGLL